MKRGRDLFRKYRVLILILSFSFKVFGRKGNEFLLRLFRKTRNKLGLALRYSVIKNICIEIGENVSIYEDVYLHNISNMSFGSNVSIHPMSYLDARFGIKIGSNVSIAHSVSIISFNHKFSSIEIPMKDQGYDGDKIEIENDVWIGAKATILSGVKIRKGSIVAAQSLVREDIIELSIMGGVPAKLIGKR